MPYAPNLYDAEPIPAAVLDTDVDIFVSAAKRAGINIQVFGASADNARACDVRLPARLGLPDCDLIAGIIVDVTASVMTSRQRTA